MARLKMFRFYGASGAKQRGDGLSFLDRLKLISPFVDKEFYCEMYPDVGAAGFNPAEHYLRHGWREGRNPSETFDTNFYLHHNMLDDGASYCPLVHYAKVGKAKAVPRNSREFAQRTISEKTDVISAIDSLFEVPVLQKSPLNRPMSRKILHWMFSAEHYRQKKGEPQISDNEALARYILFDVETGMSPGPFFVTSFYLEQIRKSVDVKSIRSPFLHWLENGVEARISPNPLYNDSEYLALNRDLAGPTPWPTWPLLHLLEHGFQEQRKINRNLALADYKTRDISSKYDSRLMEFMSDCLSQPQMYQEMRVIDDFRNSTLFNDLVREAAILEPSIGALTPDLPSHISPYHESTYFDFQAILDAIPKERYDTVIFMPFCKMGGADFIAGCLAHALSSTHKVLILRTDDSEWACPHWFPKNLVSIDISPFISRLDGKTSTRVIYNVVRALKPGRVINVNSRACFETFLRFGGRLKVFCSLYAYYFCSDQTEDGVEVGYPVWYFSQIIEHLSGAFIDNAALARTLSERFLLPASMRTKLKVAYTPMMGEMPKVPYVVAQTTSCESRPRPLILWAGRFDRQKRFDLVVEIARLMPEIDLHCWGKAVLDKAPDLSDLPANLKIFPPFTKHDELPLGESDGWLYTSAWDGLPTILIECGGLGLPIVASLVGGVGELIDNQTGWPVADATHSEAYVSALRKMLSQPEERLARAAALQKVVATRHTMRSYKSVIGAELALEEIG